MKCLVNSHNIPFDMLWYAKIHIFSFVSTPAHLYDPITSIITMHNYIILMLGNVIKCGGRRVNQNKDLHF